MDQNLYLYRIFYTTANSGNISRAAKELYISQPAVSKAIRRLEESLSVQLFIRKSRGVQLTEEGEMLYNYVKTAFQSLAVGEEQIRQIAELGIGHLRIGVSTTLCKYVLLSYLKPFVASHPHIRISIDCQSTNRTVQLLEDGVIDIGLIAKPSQAKEVDFFPLGEIQDTFVAANTYIENMKIRKSNHQEDVFQNATLMLLDKENMTRQYIDDYFTEHKIYPNNLLEITTMDLLIEFARIGLGVACVIREFVTDDLIKGTLQELTSEIQIHKREIGFAHKKNLAPIQSVSDFIAFYQENTQYNFLSDPV